jgi:hypothetical protein
MPPVSLAALRAHLHAPSAPPHQRLIYTATSSSDPADSRSMNLHRLLLPFGILLFQTLARWGRSSPPPSALHHEPPPCPLRCCPICGCHGELIETMEGGQRLGFVPVVLHRSSLCGCLPVKSRCSLPLSWWIWK